MSNSSRRTKKKKKWVFKTMASNSEFITYLCTLHSSKFFFSHSFPCHALNAIILILNQRQGFFFLINQQNGATLLSQIQTPQRHNQLSERLHAKTLQGNEQPHVLLTFKLEAVETNTSVCLCLESDLQSLGGEKKKKKSLSSGRRGALLRLVREE